jgi:hypothetical protein
MRYGATAECKLAPGSGPEDLGELIGPLMDALEKRGGEDVGVGTIASDRIIEIDLSVVADDLRSALDRAVVIVGGAIIDIGGNIEAVEKQIPEEQLMQDLLHRAMQEARGVLHARINHIKWSLDPEESDLLADA